MLNKDIWKVRKTRRFLELDLCNYEAADKLVYEKFRERIDEEGFYHYPPIKFIYSGRVEEGDIFTVLVKRNDQIFRYKITGEAVFGRSFEMVETTGELICTSYKQFTKQIVELLEGIITAEWSEVRKRRIKRRRE